MRLTFVCCALAFEADAIVSTTISKEHTGHKANPLSNPKLIDQNFYCPKEFVPGRPGGFLHTASKRGCCVLDKSLGYMELIYRLNTCLVYSGEEETAPCWAGWPTVR
jgi:hypothetical protein